MKPLIDSGFHKPILQKTFGSEKTLLSLDSPNSSAHTDTLRPVLMEKNRFFFLAGLFLLLVMGVVVQCFKAAKQPCETDGAVIAHNRQRPLRNLKDRHGLLIASSLRTLSVYADPSLPHTQQEVILKKLCHVFPDVSPELLRRRLALKKRFVWIKRHLNAKEKKRFLQAGLPGFFLMQDAKRVYPHGRLFSHVVGFRDTGGVGLCGLEKSLDIAGRQPKNSTHQKYGSLQTKDEDQTNGPDLSDSQDLAPRLEPLPGTSHGMKLWKTSLSPVIRTKKPDAGRRATLNTLTQKNARNSQKRDRAHLTSKTILSSLDTKLQHLVRTELLAALRYWEAEEANALLIHCETGEILSMVSLPDFNPHCPQKSAPSALFNRNVSGVYEMGSVMKMHNVAMAVENGGVSLKSTYDASSPLRFGRFFVRDVKQESKRLTLKEAFLRSSNIVNAKIAMLAGSQAQKSFFKKMNFFSPVPLELPETASPLMPKVWNEVSTGVMAYGYSMALTYLHLAQSVATLVTGMTCPLTLMKRTHTPKKHRVLSSRTVQLMRTLLRQTVTQGLAKKAGVDGYDIGAKTGTANLLVNGAYRPGQNLVTCVSIFPTKNPQYVLVVSLKKPKAKKETFGYATAGWIAAPTSKAILNKILPHIETQMPKGIPLRIKTKNT